MSQENGAHGSGRTLRTAVAEGATADEPVPSGFLLEVIGFGCFMFLFVYVAVMPTLPLLSYASFRQASLLLCVVAAALAAGLVGLYMLSRSAKASFGTICLVGSVLVLAHPAIAIVASIAGDIPFIVVGLCQIAYGFGLACISISWVVYFDNRQHLRTQSPVVAGTGIGTALFFFMFIQDRGVVLSAVEFAIISICAIVIAAVLARGFLSCIKVPASRPRKLSLPAVIGSLTGGSHGVAFGLAAILLCQMGAREAVIGCSAGIVGACGALAWSHITLRYNFSLSESLRVSTSCMVAALGLYALLTSPTARLLCLSLAIVSITFDMILFWISNSVHSFEFGEDSLRQFAIKQSADWLWFAAGVGIGLALIMSYGLSEHVIAATAIILIILMVIAYSFADAEKMASDMALATLAAGGEVAQGETPVSRDVVEERCAVLAEKYGLTARETEVFLLLARGRNAKAIKDKLVISESTAKTHIYNIYRKVGINSQQVLINLIEESGTEGDIASP